MNNASEHKLIRTLYYTALVFILGVIAYALYELFLLIAGGFFLAFLSRPVVDKIEREGFSRVVSTGVYFLFMICMLTITLVISFPILQAQITETIANQAQYLAQLEHQVQSARQLALEYLSPEEVLLYEGEIRKNVHELYLQSQDVLLLGAQAFAAQLGMIIFIPVVAFFFLVQGHQIQKELIRHVPNRYFEMTLMMVHHVNLSISGYLRGQFLNCLAIGTLASIGLSLIGVSGAIAIGAFAGLANAIPYLGPIVGAIPAILMLMLDPSASSPWWYVPIVFLLINLLDNVLIYPMTVGKSLELHPLIAILGILFGGAFGGVPGMIIAVPLISIITKTFRVFHNTLRFYRII